MRKRFFHVIRLLAVALAMAAVQSLPAIEPAVKEPRAPTSTEQKSKTQPPADTPAPQPQPPAPEPAPSSPPSQPPSAPSDPQSAAGTQEQAPAVQDGQTQQSGGEEAQSAKAPKRFVPTDRSSADNSATFPVDI